jgi:hypothetical protein
MYKPYQYVSVKHEGYSHVGEVISYEIDNSDDQTVMIRLVPGDPSTIVEVPINCIKPVKGNYKWVHYAVTWGFGQFPIDMLRYDCAAPVNFTFNDDGEAILNEGEINYIVARCSELKRWTWTYERWRSFMWNIEPLKTLKM